MKFGLRFTVLTLLAISSSVVLYFTILPYVQTYYPPPSDQKGWRKDTRPEFVQSLGIDPKKLSNWFGVVYEPPINPFWMSTLLIKDGWILSEEYFYHEVRNTKLYLPAMEKAATLILFGMALEDATKSNIKTNLALDGPLYDPTWLPQGFPLSDSKKNLIQFSHVLEHNSGLCPLLAGCGDLYKDGKYEPTALPPISYIDWVVGHDPLRDRPKSLFFPPGQAEHYDGDQYWKGYSSIGYAHLGLVLSNVYDQSISNLFHSKLLSPIGIVQNVDSLNQSTTASDPMTLSLTPRDFARLAYLLLKQGKWKDEQLVPKSWMEQLQQDGRYPNYTTNKDYAFGERYPKDMVRLGGAAGTFAYIVPSLDLIALRTNNNGSPGEREREAKFLSVLFDAIQI